MIHKVGDFLCSLKSLPTANEEEHSGDDNCSMATNNCIDYCLVRDAARYLMRNLGLTIFGFDVVVSSQFYLIFL